MFPGTGFQSFWALVQEARPTSLGRLTKLSSISSSCEVAEHDRRTVTQRRYPAVIEMGQRQRRRLHGSETAGLDLVEDLCQLQVLQDLS